MIYFKKIFIRLAICFIHSIGLVWFSLYWLSLSFTLPDEAFLIKLSAIFSKLILQQDTKPNPERFVFINISGDKSILEKEDGKREVITNRQHLAKLFAVLNKHPKNYRFVLCDVLLEDKTNDDDVLKKEIERLDNILLAAQSQHQKIKKPIFKVPYGLTEYSASPDGEVYKYRLVNPDGHKSLPLLMYEKLHQASFQKGNMLHYLNGQWSLNALVLDLKIRNHDIFHKELYKVIHLYELLPLLQANEKTFFDIFLKNRIIVIGNFDEDKVESSFGDLSGSLLLLNVYLMLENGETLFPLSLLFSLLLFYMLISYFLFYKPFFKKMGWLEKFRAAKFTQSFSYFLLLIGFSSVSYFIYDIHLNIFILALYLGLVAWIRRIILQKKKVKDLWNDFRAYFYLPKNQYTEYLNKTHKEELL
jgi:hypothetical protein